MKGKKKEEQVEEEDLPTDTWSEELSDGDLEEFRPRDRDEKKEKEVLEGLESHQQKKRKNDPALNSLKNSLFDGASITREDVLEGKPGARQLGKASVKELKETGDRYGVEKSSARQALDEEEEEKEALLAGGANKMERLEMMKEREERRKAADERKRQQKIKDMHAKAELGIGAEEEVRRTGTGKVTITFDSDEERERLAKKKKKKKKNKGKEGTSPRAEKAGADDGDVVDVRAGMAGANSKPKKKKKKAKPITEVDIFDDDEWDAMMSKPLKSTQISNAVAADDDIL